MKLIDLTGQKFGKLTVLERDTTRLQDGTYWLCQCDCGNIISVRKDQLTRKKYPKKSCGCDQKEIASKTHLKNEIGNRYGYLTVVSRVSDLRKGEARWHCICDCGAECDVSGLHLRNGTVTSCGCKLFESHNLIDETGKRYGKLTVLEPAGKLDGTHMFWRCQCDCGNIRNINGTYLRAGISTNCGCERSVGEAKIQKILTDNNIKFKREHTFADLLGDGGGRLRFDFGVLDNNNNLLYLIEYDGVQHFDQSCFGKDEENFDILKKYDKIKNEYCIKNNIPLIRINYKKLATLNINDLLYKKEGDINDNESAL